MMINLKEKIIQLKEYFLQRPEVSMVYIFGSYAKELDTSNSDFDIAVYFKPENNKVEWEENKKYPGEDEISDDVEKIIGLETDFVVLNRAKVTLADEIIDSGIPVLIKDRGLYLDFMLIVTDEAENFREYIKDFWEIEQRSFSLSEKDKTKLTERIKFLDNELSIYDYFRDMSLEIYANDRIKRLSVERWIENLVNTAIDIAKIMLASEKKRIPEKYKDTLLELGFFNGFDKENATKLAKFSKLRNILAHEYLDLRFMQIKEFIETAEQIYKYLIGFVNDFIR